MASRVYYTNFKSRNKRSLPDRVEMVSQKAGRMV